VVVISVAMLAAAASRAAQTATRFDMSEDYTFAGDPCILLCGTGRPRAYIHEGSYRSFHRSGFPRDISSELRYDTKYNISYFELAWDGCCGGGQLVISRDKRQCTLSMREVSVVSGAKQPAC
jgi:hypothetical protein